MLASEMHQSQASGTATLERPVEPAASEPTSGFAPEPPTATVREAEPESDPGVQAASEGGFIEEPAEPAVEDVSPTPEDEAETRPWGIPVPGPAPTAEVMTARGAALLSEGKLQEAIDQFTKAIALDPRHREALERRAEAYSQQGRQDRADEDYRQVQALNTGS